MYRVVFVVAALLILPIQAEAQPHSYLHRVLRFQQTMAMSPSDEKVVSGRPSGCPNAFCGCEASLYKFGRIVPELNLAGNWLRFPRAAPAPGMAAVRSSHVMVLQQHVSGDIWYVHDGNSGGHVTREHPRSIAGYAIVDPGAGSVPSSGSATLAQASSSTRQARASSSTRLARATSPSGGTNSQTLFAN